MEAVSRKHQKRYLLTKLIGQKVGICRNRLGKLGSTKVQKDLLASCRPLNFPTVRAVHKPTRASSHFSKYGLIITLVNRYKLSYGIEHFPFNFHKKKTKQIFIV